MFFLPCWLLLSALGLQRSGCGCPWATETSWEGAGPCHPLCHLPGEGDAKPNCCCSCGEETAANQGSREGLPVPGASTSNSCFLGRKKGFWEGG